jgi:hypothetical protein
MRPHRHTLSSPRLHAMGSPLRHEPPRPPGPSTIATGRTALETFKVGDVILGKYEVTRVLGKGGVGVVLAARHRELHEFVALKFLLPYPAGQARDLRASPKKPAPASASRTSTSPASTTSGPSSIQPGGRAAEIFVVERQRLVDVDHADTTHHFRIASSSHFVGRESHDGDSDSSLLHGAFLAGRDTDSPWVLQSSLRLLSRAHRGAVWRWQSLSSSRASADAGRHLEGRRATSRAVSSRTAPPRAVEASRAEVSMRTLNVWSTQATQTTACRRRGMRPSAMAKSLRSPMWIRT